jgi:glycosyltransferase involved in cell wall biosynthesis
MKGKLKFLFISARFWPDLGGAERQLSLLTSSLVRQGHGVTVICQKSGGRPAREERDGVEVLRFAPRPGGGLSSLLFGLSLSLFMARRGRAFDGVHVSLASSPALFVAPWIRWLRSPALLRFGASGPYGDAASSQRTALGRWKLRRLRSVFSAYLCLNEEIRREFLDLGFSPERLVLFRNGVDDTFFRPREKEDRKELRLALEWTGKTVALFTGRLEPQKNLPFLLKAWKGVAAKRPEALLVIAGDGGEEEKLRTLAGDPSLAAAVSFTGRADSEGLRRMLQAADLFIMPSLSEGMSNAVLEAMACGLPVAASDIPGNRDLVRSGETGFLFPLGDERSLGGPVDQLLANPSLRSRMGGVARRRAAGLFGIDRVAGDFVELVSRIVKTGGATSSGRRAPEGGRKPKGPVLTESPAGDMFKT